MKTIVVAFLLIITLAISDVSAESLQPAAWQAYGIAFQAPAGYTVEDDSEEGYIISTPTYFITVQLLDGEGIQRKPYRRFRTSAILRSVPTRKL